MSFESRQGTDGATGGTEMKESAKETGGVPGLLEGKRGLIFGVANRRSIAWSIARIESSCV